MGTQKHSHVLQNVRVLFSTQNMLKLMGKKTRLLYCSLQLSSNKAHASKIVYSKRRFKLFPNILLGVSNGLDPDKGLDPEKDCILSVLIWVQTICKGYQQTGRVTIKWDIRNEKEPGEKL